MASKTFNDILTHFLAKTKRGKFAPLSYDNEAKDNRQLAWVNRMGANREQQGIPQGGSD